MSRETVQGKIVDVLAGLGAKEIQIHFPSNMHNSLFVTFKYMKDSCSFGMSRCELKGSADIIFNSVTYRFNAAISKSNSCQHMSIDPNTPTLPKMGT